jgi:hypothetical protein
MATVQPSSEAARRAAQLRELWERTHSPVMRSVRKAGRFLVEHPALAQGVYYVLAGLWPLVLVHLVRSTSGEAMWLSQVGGVLMLVIGAALCVAAYRHNRAIEVWLLALGSAGGLLVLELASIFQGAISPVYLIDAFLQAGIVGLWVTNWIEHRRDVATTTKPPPAVPPATAPAVQHPPSTHPA